MNANWKGEGAPMFLLAALMALAAVGRTLRKAAHGRGTAGESAGIYTDDGITINGGTFTGRNCGKWVRSWKNFLLRWTWTERVRKRNA